CYADRVATAFSPLSLHDALPICSKMAAMQLLRALGPEDQAALAGFDSRYWGLVAFTRDKAAVEQELDKITPFGSTALHDALDKRSEEHTSELQSRVDLVCRLLLE